MPLSLSAARCVATRPQRPTRPLLLATIALLVLLALATTLTQAVEVASTGAAISNEGSSSSAVIRDNGTFDVAASSSAATDDSSVIKSSSAAGVPASGDSSVESSSAAGEASPSMESSVESSSTAVAPSHADAGATPSSTAAAADSTPAEPVTQSSSTAAPAQSTDAVESSSAAAADVTFVTSSTAAPEAAIESSSAVAAPAQSTDAPVESSSAAAEATPAAAAVASSTAAAAAVEPVAESSSAAAADVTSVASSTAVAADAEPVASSSSAVAAPPQSDAVESSSGVASNVAGTPSSTAIVADDASPAQSTESSSAAAAPTQSTDSSVESSTAASEATPAEPLAQSSSAAASESAAASSGAEGAVASSSAAPAGGDFSSAAPAAPGAVASSSAAPAGGDFSSAAPAPSTQSTESTGAAAPNNAFSTGSEFSTSNPNSGPSAGDSSSPSISTGTQPANQSASTGSAFSPSTSTGASASSRSSTGASISATSSTGSARTSSTGAGVKASSSTGGASSTSSTGASRAASSTGASRSTSSTGASSRAASSTGAASRLPSSTAPAAPVYTNAPIKLTAPESISIAPSTDASLVWINVVAGVTDADTAVFPRARASILITASGANGKVRVTDLGANVTSSDEVNKPLTSFTLTGPVTALNTLLAAGKVEAGGFQFTTDGTQAYVSLFASDFNNGIAPYTGSTDQPSTDYKRVVVNIDCGLSDPPQLKSALVSSALNSFDLTFDSEFLVKLAAGASTFDCMTVLSPTTYAMIGGAAASCSRPDALTFTYKFGKTNTVAKNSNVTLAEGVISKCAAATKYASGSIGLTLPSSAVKPAVSYTAVATVSPCDDIVVTAVRIGDVLQSPPMTWTVSTLNDSSISSTTGTTLTVSKALLKPGTVYTISASFTNAFGVVSDAQSSVDVLFSSVAVANVRIQGEATRKFQRGSVADLYPLQASVSLPPCLTLEGASTLNFAWTVSPALIGSTAVVNKPKFSLSLATLLDNTDYLFKLNVTSGPNSVITTVQIRLDPADLVISPSVGPSRQVAYVDTFSQQVSVVDPSPNAVGEIVYTWSCVDSTGTMCTGLNPPNAAEWKVPALALTAGSYVLSVYAEKDTRRTSTVNFPVTVLPTQPPQVAVKCPSSKLNVDSPLSISSSVTPRNPGQSTISYVWSTFATGLGPVPAADLNPTSANFVVNNAAVAYWTPGADYVMTLTVTETTGAVANSISASCPVSIRALPFGGSLTVSPTEGLAFNTSFTISAPQWQADSGALTYAFYRKLGSSLLPLSSVQSDSSFSTQLPTATNEAGTHTIVVKVVDMFGATTIVESAPVKIVVPAVPLDTAQLSNILSTGLTAALQTGNADAALALISGIASSAAASTDGSGTPAPVTAEAVALTDSLVSNIAQFAESVSPAQMVGTLTAVAANPELLSPTAVAGITNILTSMFGNVLASSAKGEAGASSTLQTGLGSSEKQGAAGMLASLLAAARTQGGKGSKGSLRRRLLQTASNEESVISVYSTAQQLLAVSGAGLTNPGSLWLSDVSTSTSTFFGVVRFSTANGATQTITGTASDYITVTSDVEEEAAMDLRFITSKPNPITWNPEANVLLTDSSAITVAIADTTGTVVGTDPMTALEPLEAYTYYVVQKFSQTDCPTVTCSPVCKLYDPESKEWTDAVIDTAVMDDKAEVTCSSSTPGTLALVKGPTRVVVPPGSPATGGSSSSSGLSPRQKGLIAMGVILFVLLVGGLLGAVFYLQRRAKRGGAAPSTTSRQAQLSNLTVENEMVGTASMHPGTSSPQAHDWDQEAASTETRHVVVHMAPSEE